MTDSISEVFRKSKSNNECALVPFITAGDPNLDVTENALKILDSEGASIIELGLPYSDSLADGPIIQAAAARALKQKITFLDILTRLKRVTPQINTPIVIFSYYNLILRQGVENFVLRIASSGAKGLLVPDLPLEESNELLSLCSTNNLELILLIAPTSSPDRIKLIANKAQGCLYVVAANGVTGLKSDFDIKVKELIHKVQNITEKPIIVGFGVSNASQAALIKSWEVSGVVLGSAFVRQLDICSKLDSLDDFASFCRDIKQALS
nr:trpA [Porphyrostromium boryanum]